MAAKHAPSIGSSTVKPAVISMTRTMPVTAANEVGCEPCAYSDRCADDPRPQLYRPPVEPLGDRYRSEQCAVVEGRHEPGDGAQRNKERQCSNAGKRQFLDIEIRGVTEE